jgi:hypothetical protein
MRASIKLLATTAILSLAATSASAATTLKFTLTGDLDASWTLPASPVPTTSSLNAFSVSNVQGVWAGVPGTRTVVFAAENAGGGIGITSANAIDFFGMGPTLFTGPTTAPTFRTGTFSLTVRPAIVRGNGTLTISSIPAIPEPATWAMMIAGFGLVGMAARRRTQTEVTA